MRARGVPGWAVEVTASTATASHPAVVVSCAGTERPIGVLLGGMVGRLNLW